MPPKLRTKYLNGEIFNTGGSPYNQCHNTHWWCSVRQVEQQWSMFLNITCIQKQVIMEPTDMGIVKERPFLKV